MSWDRTKGRPEPIAALNRIPLRENGEPLVDLREAAPSVRIGRPQVIPWVREQVARMAESAAASLPEGYFLAVNEAWRPLARQKRIFDFFYDSAKEVFPHLGHAALRRIACRWAAPVGQKAPPGHCTGGAIDVMLVAEDGAKIDVSSPLEGMRSNPTHAFGLSPLAQSNRDLLLRAMTRVGFSNCRDEWWHYSYGDAAWAVRLEKPFCVYGLAELELELYREQEEQWIEAFKERQNPFRSNPAS